jgi:hypothetical protein
VIPFTVDTVCHPAPWWATRADEDIAMPVAAPVAVEADGQALVGETKAPTCAVPSGTGGHPLKVWTVNVAGTWRERPP